MADIDVTTLDNIFRMITPADLIGAQKLSVGKKIDVQLVRELLHIIYGLDGAKDIDSMAIDLETFQTKVTDANAEAKDQYKRIVHLYKTGKPCTAFGDAPFMFMGDDGKTPTENATFDQVVGKSVKLEDAKKAMGVILCNSGFLSPAVRNAERVELFMNFMPSIIASRMVPLLEVEFAFNRAIPPPDTAQPHQWSPGLLKFLLGGDNSLATDETSPTKKMLDLRETQDSSNKKVTTLHSIAGMEMFTSPQTLINASPSANAGRYVDVIDPMRPLMTIESFSVNVSPQPGLYSYKKATLVFKLHDRSRLSEIADLVRPQVYQDRGSAPTLWITYGWRHPNEPGNPYADFINGNMLVREAYGIINTQFAFDQTGQVTVTMNLWTKGVPELRTLSVNDDGSLAVVQKLKQLGEEVTRNRMALGLGPVDGANKEIRGFLLIEAAERGALPDMTDDDIQKALQAITESLRSPKAKLDTAAVEQLLAKLNELYSPKDKKYLDFKKTLETQATKVTTDRFNEVITGADPFLPFAKKNEKTKTQSKKEDHPLTSVVEALNVYQGEAEIKTFATPVNKSTLGFRKKVASFGKLLAVFTANVLKQLDSVDEMQIYFYQFNSQAGPCSGANIAEFPIEMPVFIDRYRDYVEKKGSERITLEEFLGLVVDTQLHDIRAIGYGFRQFYAAYDPAKKQAVELATGYKPDLVELAKREFRMPAIGFYLEAVYAATPTTMTTNDRLAQFESTDSVPGTANGGRANHYTKVMRIHIFDKNNNPYKLADAILQDEGKTVFVETNSAFLKQQVQDKTKDAANIWSEVMKGVLTSDGKIDRSKVLAGGASNQEIKNFVSKMVPTIVYGGNASSVITANLASKQDPLLATTQMQALARGNGRPSNLSPNGSDVGGLPLRIVPASMTLTTLGCPLLTYAQMFFIDFNTGTTIDNIYGLTGLTHTIHPGKFESTLTLTFADAYGKFFGAPTIVDYVKGMQVPAAKK